MDNMLIELDVLQRVIEFANWLEQGVEVTDDDMLKHVLENFEACFEDYLQKKEGNKNGN